MILSVYIYMHTYTCGTAYVRMFIRMYACFAMCPHMAVDLLLRLLLTYPFISFANVRACLLIVAQSLMFAYVCVCRTADILLYIYICSSA